MRRIWAHWGVELDDADLAAALDVSSHAVVKAHLDPAYGEDVAPDRRARLACRFAEPDVAVLRATAGRHLRHAFGYGDRAHAAEPAPAPARRTSAARPEA